ncbi:hypothetical protein PIB30_054223 [Stylosanthes scabra]|uniref:RNase H type-1 domain-containing protein n=1 Tax=Stylosanthes scabra TaxID=79078 RepID=A0ABU6UI51_9FABA|nr:hypothetical protein [Stylosanthes scabra]
MSLDSSFRCELFALWRGLILAWDHGHKNVICETDNVDVYRVVQLYPCNNIALHADLITKIHDLLCRSWNVDVCLIQRNANDVVDTIAKLAARNGIDHAEWLSPWSSLDSSKNPTRLGRPAPIQIQFPDAAERGLHLPLHGSPPLELGTVAAAAAASELEQVIAAG